jgi:hypothetical protein
MNTPEPAGQEMNEADVNDTDGNNPDSLAPDRTEPERDQGLATIPEESANASEPASLRASPVDRGTCFVLTNRMNLNGILSSRIVGPRGAYAKYYRDLLELTDGRVAVLHGAPSPELVQYVSEKVRTGPALLELAAGSKKGQSTDPSDTALVEFADAIPLCDIAAIHLPNESSLREHLARHYNNVHPHEDLLRVSPELFNGPVARADVEEAASSSSNLQDERMAVDWQRLDRVRGAMNAAVLAATTPGTLKLAQGLLPDSDASHWLGAFLRDDERPESTATADDLLLMAVADVLVATDVRQAWDPASILSQIKSRLEATPSAGPHLELIAANIATVANVLDGTREFTPFRRTSRGLVSAKALLLILLRQELSELLAWPASETGADPSTCQLAALFAGLLRGLSRESVSFRNEALDDVTAVWVCTFATGHPSQGSRARPRVLVEDTDAETRLLLGGEVLKGVPADVPGPAQLFRALSPVVQQQVASPLAKVLGTTDALSIVVTADRADIQSPVTGGVTITLPGDAIIEQRWDLEALATQIEDAPQERIDALMETLEGTAAPATDREHGGS